MINPVCCSESFNEHFEKKMNWNIVSMFVNVELVHSQVLKKKFHSFICVRHFCLFLWIQFLQWCICKAYQNAYHVYHSISGIYIWYNWTAGNISFGGKFSSITKKMHKYWNRNIVQTPFISNRLMYIQQKKKIHVLFIC